MREMIATLSFVVVAALIYHARYAKMNYRASLRESKGGTRVEGRNAWRRGAHEINAWLRRRSGAVCHLSDRGLTEPPPPRKGPVDGLASSPGNFKLLLENDRVRVLQYTLPPGARDHWHTHPSRVGYVLSGAKIRVTEADGSHEDYDEKTGDTYWGEFSPLHDTLNLDTTPYIALLIEVKGANSSSASADEPARQIALAIATQMLAQKPAAK